MIDYDKGYQEGVLDAVEYLSELYGEDIYDTQVFFHLGVRDPNERTS